MLSLSSLRMMYCFCDWPFGAPLATGALGVLRLDADGAPARVAAGEDGEDVLLEDAGGMRLVVDASVGLDELVR